MSDEPSPIPARKLPVSATAPGKCILFGEHSVVRGAPELLLAIDLRTQVVASAAARTALNGDPTALEHHPYLRRILAGAPGVGDPLDVRSVSRVPRSAGLGSSAAFVVALSAALAASEGGLDRSELARRAFVAEHGAQGVGSPGDTSASVAGGYVTLNGAGGEPLWSIEGERQTWEVRRAPDPGWSWVVAYSGIPRSTAEAVRAVGERLEQADGPELLERFRAVAAQGIAAVARGDREEVGRQMLENQQLLREVGVSHPRLEALLEAAAPCSLGAKLTGAGRGGSILVLPIPGREVELVRRLARAGAVPFVVSPSEGAELVDAPTPH